MGIVNEMNCIFFASKLIAGDSCRISFRRLQVQFDWSKEQVSKWLQSHLVLSQYTQSFLSNRINGARFAALTDREIIQEIEVKNSSHVKIIKDYAKNISNSFAPQIC